MDSEIKVKLSLIEDLKHQIKTLEKDNKMLTEKLSSVDENNLKWKYINFSFHLFECFVKSLFKQMGFLPPNKNYSKYVDVNYEIINKLKNIKTLSEIEKNIDNKIEFDFHFEIYNQTKNFLLHMGLVVNDESDNKN